MLVTAVLAAAVGWGLFYGRLPSLPLGLLCAGLGTALAFLGHHTHGGTLSIDLLAQRSRLNQVNASLKAGGCLFLLICCISARSPYFGLGMAALALILTVPIGKLPLHDYLSLFSLPASFLLISSLALLVSFRPEPSGVLNLPFFSGWLCITAGDQIRTLLILSRALGAVSCLYLLSLSTPMPEIISVLRRAHVPAIMVELMYLIYRYIFLLLEMHCTMHDAAESRLGYQSYRTGLRTTGLLYANLLARSFQKASSCFDAMESRCYTGEIRFLETKKPIPLLHGLTAGAILLLSFLLAFFL